MANEYKSILVAVDGSKEAEYALHKAFQVAKRNEGSTLHIVHIMDNRAFVQVDVLNTNLVELIESEARELLEGYEKEAHEAGVENVKVILEHGTPKMLLPTILPELYHIDLILCGATGRNAIERLFIGSVSQEIVRQAKCDVLVIRTPDSEEQ